MHKGRGWRQVLPRIITPDYTVGGAPVFIAMIGSFQYASGELSLQDEVWEPSDSHLGDGTIRWRLHFSRGLYNFIAEFGQAVVQNLEGTFYQLLIADEFGGASVTHWTRHFYQTSWHLTYAPPNLLQFPDGQISTGFFGRTFGTRVRPIPYHEEP